MLTFTLWEPYDIRRSASCHATTASFPRQVLVHLMIPLLTVILSGCALFQTSVQDDPVNLGQVCAPATPPLRQARLDPHSAPSQEGRQPDLDQFSERAQETAAALGLVPLLRELVTLETREEGEKAINVELLAVHHEALGRLFLADQEIGRVEGEVSCEQGRIQELTDLLQTQKNRRSNIQTLAAVVVQGVATIFTGALVLGGTTVAEDAISIAGGAIGATLGSFAILQRGEQRLDHPRNLLREMRQGRGEGGQIVPESVWRLLTSSEERDQSRRKQLLDHWSLELDHLKQKEGNRGMNLLLGDGGSYTLDDLRTRSAMLRTFIGTLRRLHEDIEALAREVLGRTIRRPA